MESTVIVLLLAMFCGTLLLAAIKGLQKAFWPSPRQAIEIAGREISALAVASTRYSLQVARTCFESRMNSSRLDWDESDFADLQKRKKETLQLLAEHYLLLYRHLFIRALLTTVPHVGHQHL